MLRKSLALKVTEINKLQLKIAKLETQNEDLSGQNVTRLIVIILLIIAIIIGYWLFKKRTEGENIVIEKVVQV